MDLSIERPIGFRDGCFCYFLNISIFVGPTEAEETAAKGHRGESINRKVIQNLH
jgi:hypothetical protein